MRTELLWEQGGDYLTIDYWLSESDWVSFQAAYRSAYETLDRRCEGLTASETKIGVFVLVGS